MVMVVAAGPGRAPGRGGMADGSTIRLAGGLTLLLQVSTTAAKDRGYVPGGYCKAVGHISYTGRLKKGCLAE